MAIILDGLAVSNYIKEQLLNFRKDNKECSPCLVVIRFGCNKDDISYQKSAEKKCKEFGIQFNLIEIDRAEKTNRFIDIFDKINKDDSVDGIIIMGEYPNDTIKEYVQRNIIPRKDMDGIGYENIAKLYSNDKSVIVPCTVEAVMRLLDFYNIELKGKKICILGRSLVIGKPLALCLVNRDATVILCHSKTIDIEDQAKQADIIVAAVGSARFINQDFVTEKSIIIDVGINFDKNGKICGDADYDNLYDCVQAITPVPKGIGSITNIILISHVYHSYLERLTIKSQV